MAHAQTREVGNQRRGVIEPEALVKLQPVSGARSHDQTAVHGCSAPASLIAPSFQIRDEEGCGNPLTGTPDRFAASVRSPDPSTFQRTRTAPSASTWNV